MAPNQIVKPKTAVAHVGVDRYEKLTQIAIDISGKTRFQVSRTQFLKFIIDTYADQAKVLLLEQMLKEIKIPEEK